MRTIETSFETFGASVLLLGYKKDNLASKIVIDCADALEEYQGATATLSIVDPEGTVYPGDVTIEAGVVTWLVKARDTAYSGRGSARLDLVDNGGTVVASCEGLTMILDTHMSGVAPDAIEDWVDEASDALTEVRALLLDLNEDIEDVAVAEAARVLAEQGRVSAEELRVIAENARVSAETGRVTAEQGRVTAEQGRVTAEQGRVIAESGRVTAEQGRVTAENDRDTAEQGRATAEQGRVTAEQGRVAAETLRQQFEEQRESNETTRENRETSRRNAEGDRQHQESLRAQAETIRNTNETNRVTAEQGRASAEQGRVTAEAARETAEEERESGYSTIEQNAQAALSYIGPSEASSTASAAHAKGSYLIYDGTLYRATADIAIGDTLSTTGTGANIAQVMGGAMGEVADVKSAIDVIRAPYGVNLFDVDALKTNTFLNAATGAEEVNSQYDASDWIPVEAQKEYTIQTYSYTGNASHRLYYYDANKNFIERKTARVSNYPTKGYVFTTPDETAYIRLNFEKQPTIAQDPKTSILVEGNGVYEYTPYYTAYDKTARNGLELKSNIIDTVINYNRNDLPTDADAVTKNSVYYIQTSDTIINLPADITGNNKAGWLVTVVRSGSVRLQFLFPLVMNFGTYFRTARSNTWDPWLQIGSRAAIEAVVPAIKLLNSSAITDANEVTETGFVYVSSNNVTNLPKTPGDWYMFNSPFDVNNSLQLSFNASGTNPYLRAKVAGVWTEWIQLGKEAAEAAKAEIASDTYITSTIAMFPSVGCCGDSFTVGYLYNKPDSDWYDPDYVPNGEYPAIGYPAVMGRLYGVDVTAYAKGGLTSTAYRTDKKGLLALRNDTPKYLYIIALGLNDVTKHVPLGVEADIDTEPETATYLGNMGAIIRAIKQHAPYARIILCKSLWMQNTYYNYISEGVELLSSHLGITFIETKGDPYFESSAYKDGLKGLHPTAPLYAGIGKRIGELVGKCIIDHPEYFYNFYVPNE